MLKLFEYNWQVREDWFNWCETVNEEELLKQRTGGVGSILYTLYHIINVELGWISGMQGSQGQFRHFEDCNSVAKLREYSAQSHAQIAPFLYAWDGSLQDRILKDQNHEGEWEQFRYGEVLQHVLVHEIHHIGQLSIWSRELGKQPVTANLIRRGLFDPIVHPSV
ncbi:putative damage-inducible protein DinB [Paenibacillus phyllosphaerae]|uniref:Putative damage-inducible protein DinB n=1 Tax=Paenibacillus phyllosphaerae TaxID=274593 RepID=A0A7W5FPM9_9BACL|nr:DinB family protein [Paenibacillus phyllosphaerae]MBB3112199.1 putative damage-inducible protein DinB [Paenibacillus phyllosphaerae]